MKICKLIMIALSILLMTKLAFSYIKGKPISDLPDLPYALAKATIGMDINEDDKHYRRCTGVAISDHEVLTAAHCIVSKPQDIHFIDTIF